MKKMLAGMILLFLSAVSSVSAGEGYVSHKIQSGETLTIISRQFGVKNYHDIMTANGMKTDQIFAGKTIRIPVAGNHIVQIKKMHKVVKNSGFVWKEVGGNPYKGSPAWAISHSNLPADVQMKVSENIRQDKFQWTIVSAGQTLDWMTFGKNEVWYNLTTGWDSSWEYAAKDYGVDGYHVVHVIKCNNWGGWKELTPEPSPEPNPGPSPEPTPEPSPDFPPDIEDQQPPVTQITPPEALCAWDWELFAITGGETDFQGNKDWFLGLEGALYPFIMEGKNAKDEFGIGGRVNLWDGITSEKFNFDGGYAALGPAWKHANYSGWDTGSKILFGKLWENGKDATGDYKSNRDFGITGIGLSYNNYERELRGEKIIPEWQLYGAMFIPISKDVRHSWQGKNIADTKDLEKFNYLLSVGGRVFLYQGEYIRPYIQAGYFAEDPITHSLSFRLGVSDVHKIIFAGIGPNINLDNSTLALAGDVGIDIMRAIEFGRAQHRRNAMIEAIQNRPEVKSFDSNTGVLILN